MRVGRNTQAVPGRRQSLWLLHVVWALLGWIPVTPSGLVVAASLAALIKWVALPKQDRVLLALALCGLVFEALSLLMVVTTAVWLRVRPQGNPSGVLRAEVGVPFRTGHALGLAAWNPLVRIELHWRAPAPARAVLVAEGLRLVEEVTAEHRGDANAVIRRFVVADVLHLARVRFDRSQTCSVAVLPARGPSPRPVVLPQLTNGDQLGHPSGRHEGDLIEMRRYAPGDPLKLVLWKLYGRTGRLLVRTPERALSPSESTLAYFIAGEADEASAGVARGFLETGALGTEVTFSADGATERTRTPGEAVHQVARSVEAREQGAVRLSSFLSDGEAEGIRACVLFAPGRPGHWLDRTVRALAGRPGPVRVFVGVDGLRSTATHAGLRRWVVRGDREPRRSADVGQVGAVVAQLEAAGALVCVVDRVSGRVLRPDELGNPTKGRKENRS
jgi:hypothetical protein